MWLQGLEKIEQDQRYPAYLQTVRGIGWRLNTITKKMKMRLRNITPKACLEECL